MKCPSTINYIQNEEYPPDSLQLWRKKEGYLMTFYVTVKAKVAGHHSRYWSTIAVRTWLFNQKTIPFFAMYTISFAHVFSLDILSVTDLILGFYINWARARFDPYQLWQHLVQKFLELPKLKR